MASLCQVFDNSPSTSNGRKRYHSESESEASDTSKSSEASEDAKDRVQNGSEVCICGLIYSGHSLHSHTLFDQNSPNHDVPCADAMVLISNFNHSGLYEEEYIKLFYKRSKSRRSLFKFIDDDVAKCDKQKRYKHLRLVLKEAPTARECKYLVQRTDGGKLEEPVRRIRWRIQHIFSLGDFLRGEKRCCN